MKGLMLVLFFLSIFLLFQAILQRLVPAKQNVMEKRINYYFTDPENVEKEDKKPKKKLRLQFNLDFTKQSVRKKLLTKDRNKKLELLLYQAGVPLKPEEYVIFQWISVCLSTGILYIIVDHIVIVPFGVIIGYLIPKIIIKRKKHNRAKSFNDALPEMIASVVGALKAGFSFPQALKSVAAEAQSPMKEEIETVLREMQYGTTMDEALNNLYERMPSEDLYLMIQAILIQRQVGGNLATVLEKIVQTIRDRIKIQGQISTLTAQGKLSGAVIGLLPVGIGFLLYLMQPEYIGKLFTHPLGIGLMIGAVVSCSVGFFLIQKITTIEV
ncbi:type II secretion system F family protein [Virgibacillus byunsanensis]|uniref:Type II secretion system F family protein n=1 Tax=Virgibacillus byunsanensis TaxID=570945 RepID=A0ABW3LHD6_9BACI